MNNNFFFTKFVLLRDNKAKIGYSYPDSSYSEPKLKTSRFAHAKLSSDEDSDNDLDLVLDVNRLTPDDKVILNKRATDFGMEFGDFIRMMIVDNEEKETVKRNKELEIEKSQYSVKIYKIFFFRNFLIIKLYLLDYEKKLNLISLNFH